MIAINIDTIEGKRIFDGACFSNALLGMCNWMAMNCFNAANICRLLKTATPSNGRHAINTYRNGRPSMRTAWPEA